MGLHVQARNIMRGMKLGDRAFFYHSNCKEVCIASSYLTLQSLHNAGADRTSTLCMLPILLSLLLGLHWSNSSCWTPAI